MSNKEQEKMHIIFFKSSLDNTEKGLEDLKINFNKLENFDEAHLINFRRQLININFAMYCLSYDIKQNKN